MCWLSCESCLHSRLFIIWKGEHATTWSEAASNNVGPCRSDGAARGRYRPARITISTITAITTMAITNPR